MTRSRHPGGSRDLVPQARRRRHKIPAFAGMTVVIGALLAGAAIGWVWARQLGFGNAFWFQRRRMEERQQALRRMRMNAEEFVTQEIDPILDKISREGVASLNRAERKILEEGRGKLAQKSAAKR